MKKSEKKYGQIVYNKEQLSEKVKYRSTDDPDALFTPYFDWCIEDQNCRFRFDEDQSISSNDPFARLNDLPESVEFTFHMYEKIKIWRITIPLSLIIKIAIKSNEHYTDNYELPYEYCCEIFLKNRYRIVISGNYCEEPEHWNYQHTVKSFKD